VTKTSGCVLALVCSFSLGAPRAHAQEVWRGDFETGDTSQLDGELNGMVGGADQITIVDDPVAEGSHAARIELVNDARWPNGLKRVELHHSPASGRTAEGSELYFAWSFFLPETLPTDPEQTIGYWETDTSYSQIMAFTLSGSDLRFSTNHPDWAEQWIGRGVITAARWHRLAMHIVWSADPSIGSVDVWLDGAQVVTGAHAATLVDANSVFTQLGLLRGAVEFTDAPVIVLDDLVEGDSLESVRPGALIPTPDAGRDLDAASTLDAAALDAAGLDASTPDARVERDAAPSEAHLSGTCSCHVGVRRGAVASWLATLVVASLTLSRARRRRA
jgi:hypothetical protein